MFLKTSKKALFDSSGPLNSPEFKSWPFLLYSNVLHTCSFSLITHQPLQAMETYFLIARLSGALQDSVGMTNALCQIAKLFLFLECPSYAEVSMK